MRSRESLSPTTLSRKTSYRKLYKGFTIRLRVFALGQHSQPVHKGEIYEYTGLHETGI